MAEKFDLMEFLSGLPSAFANTGLDFAGGLVRNGGLGGMIDLLIPAELAKDNPQIVGIIKNFAAPALKRVNDSFVDWITGTAGMDVPMSTFANSNGYSTQLYAAQQALISSGFSHIQKGDKGYIENISSDILGSVRYDANSMAKDLFGKAAARSLGYDENTANFMADSSIFGSIVNNIGASQLKEFRGIGTGLISDLIKRDARNAFGITETDNKGQIVLDDARRVLAAYGANQISRELVNDFYGIGDNRKYGSLNINDVSVLADIAAERTKAPSFEEGFTGKDADGKTTVTESGKSAMDDYSRQIAATVERLANSVDNVRDVLGRQVSADAAIKFLSAMSGTNVLNMGTEAMAALSSEFRAVGVRTGLDAKEFGEVVKGGVGFYSRLGLDQALATRLELDRLSTLGKPTSKVVGYSDEDVAAGHRRLLANSEFSGASDNLRTLYAAYIGQTNGKISQEGFDAMVTRLSDAGVDISSIRSTKDVQLALSKLGYDVTQAQIEDIASSTDTRVIGRAIDVNKYGLRALGDSMSKYAANIADNITDTSILGAKGTVTVMDEYGEKHSLEMYELDNDLQLLSMSRKDVAEMTYAELSDRLASTEGLDVGARGRIMALREHTIRQVSYQYGISYNQASQMLADQGYINRLQAGVEFDRSRQYATGMQGILQFLQNPNGEITIGNLASVALLGVSIKGDQYKAFIDNLSKGTKEQRSLAEKLRNGNLSLDDTKKKTLQDIAARHKNGELSEAEAYFESAKIITKAEKDDMGAAYDLLNIFTGKTRKYGMDAASEASKGNELAAFVYGTGRTADGTFRQLVGKEFDDLNKRLSDGELSSDDREVLSKKADELIASGTDDGKRLGTLLKKRVTEGTSSGEANAANVATAAKTEEIAAATQSIKGALEQLTGHVYSIEDSITTIKRAYTV